MAARTCKDATVVCSARRLLDRSEGHCAFLCQATKGSPWVSLYNVIVMPYVDGRVPSAIEEIGLGVGQPCLDSAMHPSKSINQHAPNPHAPNYWCCTVKRKQSFKCSITIVGPLCERGEETIGV